MGQAETFNADEFVEEVKNLPAPRPAETMGRLAKVNYSHVDMIDFLIANPGTTQRDLAARYGYSEGWISNVMAADAWQSLMAKRRSELVDPVLAATIDDRFRMITARSMDRLMEKLNAPVVSDNTVLKAIELGAKAMGVGGNAAPAAPAGDHLAQLATRLIELQANVRHQNKISLREVYEGTPISREDSV